MAVELPVIPDTLDFERRPVGWRRGNPLETVTVNLTAAHKTRLQQVWQSVVAKPPTHRATPEGKIMLSDTEQTAWAAKMFSRIAAELAKDIDAGRI